MSLFRWKMILWWTGLVSVKMKRSRQIDSRWFLEIRGFVNRLVWKSREKKKSKMPFRKAEELGGGAIY